VTALRFPIHYHNRPLDVLMVILILLGILVMVFDVRWWR